MTKKAAALISRNYVVVQSMLQSSSWNEASPKSLHCATRNSVVVMVGYTCRKRQEVTSSDINPRSRYSTWQDTNCVNRETFWTSYQEDSKKQIVLQLDFQWLISGLVSRAGSDDSR